jgi:hypothetical protein
MADGVLVNMIFIMGQRREKRQCPVSVRPYSTSTRRTLRVVDFFTPLRWLLSSALGIIRPKSQIFSDDSYTEVITFNPIYIMRSLKVRQSLYSITTIQYNDVTYRLQIMKCRYLRALITACNRIAESVDVAGIRPESVVLPSIV